MLPSVYPTAREMDLLRSIFGGRDHPSVPRISINPVILTLRGKPRDLDPPTWGWIPRP